MNQSNFDEIHLQFAQTLEDCKYLYLSAARDCIDHHPTLLSDSPQEFLQMMGDLHKGLLIKTYVSVVEPDQRWSREEKKLAQTLFKHLWKEHIGEDRLREASKHIFKESRSLQWSSLIRPFDQMAPLRSRISELETIVTRLANLVVKCDGHVTQAEAAVLRNIEYEIVDQLRSLPIDESHKHNEVDHAGTQAVEQMKAESGGLFGREGWGGKKNITVETPQTETSEVKPKKSDKERLSEALQELESLIGMNSVKKEVQTLINFIELQQQRKALNLPVTNLSLHLVFGGNPGTGKTTVARIVGRIYGAMGLLQKGHLVETDRSGLVAEYAGQTGPKANKKVDESLDGVLFIDEAYSLVAEGAEDAFGREAIQTLLKRMEDDRKRLVVILAGYPEPIENLLRSNPGLSSRFSTKLTFEDYTPGDLGRIFQLMCDKNHYEVPAQAQAKLLLGLQWHFENRDEHFGNGRLVRNIFEAAIRALANRIADIAPVTKELLTIFRPEDIKFESVPEHVWDNFDPERQRFAIPCPAEQCDNLSHVTMKYLGRRVKCKVCEHRFVAAWGEPCERTDLPE